MPSKLRKAISIFTTQQNNGDYTEDVKNQAVRDKGSPSECLTMLAFPFVHFEMKFGLQKMHRQGTCYPQTQTLTLPPFPPPPPLHPSPFLPFIPLPPPFHPSLLLPSILPPSSPSSLSLLPFIPPSSSLSSFPPPTLHPSPTITLYVCVCVGTYLLPHSDRIRRSPPFLNPVTWSAGQPDVTTK